MSSRPAIADGLGDQLRGRLRVLHVGLQVVDLVARVLEPRDDLGLRHAGGQDHMRAGLGERLGDAEPDAARGAGDERDLPVDAEKVHDHGCAPSKFVGGRSAIERRSQPPAGARRVEAEDEVGAAVAEHHRRRVGVAGVDVRASPTCRRPGGCRCRARACRESSTAQRIAVGAHAAGAGGVVVGLHEAPAMRRHRFVAEIAGPRARSRFSKRSAERARSAARRRKKRWPATMIRMSSGSLQQVRRDQRHVVRIGRAQLDVAARLRLHQHGGDGHAVGVLEDLRRSRSR